MNYSNFFYLGSDYKKGCLQVTAKEIKDEIPYVYGEARINSPIIFEHYMGGKNYDLLETGWGSLYLLSEKVISAFEKSDINGWKKYPAKVYDKKMNIIKGYSILAITGRCGPIDDSLSKLTWKDPPVPEGSRYQVKKGLYFDLSSWDGNDIFIPKNSLYIIITKKVRDLLLQLEATNFNIKPISEIESDIF